MPTIKKTAVKKTVVKKAIAKKRNAKTPTNYLTKRILTAAAKNGFTKAAEETVAVMGFNVIVHEGWVVKKYADGRIERMKKLATTKPTKSLVLD